MVSSLKIEHILTAVFFTAVLSSFLLFTFFIIKHALEKVEPGIPGQVFGTINFSKLEEHVSGVPYFPKIRELVEYLIQITANDAEKAYVIYYWLTQNIKYDYDALGSYKRKQIAAYPDKVFKRRKGICEGISRLFCNMAQYAGIDSEYIVGKTSSGNDNGHAWNTVKINRKWYLIDVTWQKFFAEPNEFSQDHMPNLKIWKLTASS